MKILREVWHSIKVQNISHSDLLKTTAIINFSHVALCFLGSPSKLVGKDCPMEGGKALQYWFVSLAGGVHGCGHDLENLQTFWSIWSRKERAQQYPVIRLWNIQAAVVKTHHNPSSISLQWYFYFSSAPERTVRDSQGKPFHSVPLPLPCCMAGLCQQSFL